MPHATPYTPGSTLHGLHFLWFTVYPTCSTLNAQHFVLQTFHLALETLHCWHHAQHAQHTLHARRILHATLEDPHSSLRMPHSIYITIPHCKLYTANPSLNSTFHSTMHSPPSMLYAPLYTLHTPPSRLSALEVDERMTVVFRKALLTV